MKYVKMLGLAALAAAALMAFVGASTASATVLCKNSTTTNGCTEKIGAGTIIQAEQTKVIKLDTTFKTVECKKSTMEGEVLQPGSATKTVSGPINSITFTECNCTVAVLKTGELEVHWVPTTDNGTLTANGQEVTVTCSTVFGNVHCIYVTENDDLGTLVGGKPATFEASVSVKRLPTDKLCSEEATWTPGYKITAPSPLFVAEQ